MRWGSLRDWFPGLGSRDVLTIGVGCDVDDYGVLAAVEVPVVGCDIVKDWIKPTGARTITRFMFKTRA